MDTSLTEDHLAKLLGYYNLRPGAPRNGFPDRPRPELFAWWSLSVEPSFDTWLTVGAVHDEIWTGGQVHDSVLIRGFVADTEGAAIVELNADLMLDALGTTNVFRVEPTYRVSCPPHRNDPPGTPETWCRVGICDGIGYVLKWSTHATDKAEIHFSNPHARWLIELEQTALRFARQVVSAAGMPRFEPHLETWRDYSSDRF